MAPSSAQVVGLQAVAAGTMAWLATCTASQLVQLSILKIHTGHRFAPSLLGALTVGAASVLSLEASAAAISVSSVGSERGDRRLRHAQISVASAALLGGACFVALGGQPWRLSPSSLAHLGALANTARGSLPATLEYASRAERDMIQQLGRNFGCHTCGFRPWLPGPLLRGSRAQRAALFHADHQPPLSEVRRANAALWRRLLNAPQTQRFYPQCVSCSNMQGELLGKKSALISKLGSARRALRALPSSTPRAIFHCPSLLRPHYASGGMLSALATLFPDTVEEVDAAVRSAGEEAASRWGAARPSTQTADERSTALHEGRK